MNVEQQIPPQEDPIVKTGLAKNNLDFGEFSRMPEYIAVNKCLTEMLLSKLPRKFFHVDVAAGTGMVEKLLIEGAEKTGKTGAIIGVDPNSTSLAIARENVISSQSVSIKFIEGIGQDLKRLLKDEIPVEGADGASIHDALHEIWSNEDKTQIIQSMADILKPEGLLSFNSAFTTIANGPDWGRWKLLSMRKLSGQQDIKRDKKNKAMPVLAPQDYKEMIQATGLVVVHEKITPVFLTKEALKAISRYPAFFQGVFDDMPGQESFSGIEKSNALVQVIEELGTPGFPKTWYEIIAQKPKAAPTP